MSTLPSPWAVIDRQRRLFDRQCREIEAGLVRRAFSKARIRVRPETIYGRRGLIEVEPSGLIRVNLPRLPKSHAGAVSTNGHVAGRTVAELIERATEYLTELRKARAASPKGRKVGGAR